MNWRSTAGKSALIKMLMKDHGFSKRKAEKAVNAVFDCMARALRRGEEVELPIGWIQTAWPPAKRKKQKLQKLKDIQTGKRSLRRVLLPDKIIRFRANPELIVKGQGPPPESAPPPPPSPELVCKGEELETVAIQIGIPGCDQAGRRIVAWRRRWESGLAAVPLADVGPGRTDVRPLLGPQRHRAADVLGS
jgi:nucleoid DNA-binding protein